MGEIILPRRMFLWSMSAIYLSAFVSLYLQIPGLYGNEGLLPARWQLRYSGKPMLEQLLSSPTLLWLGPQLGLDSHSFMELLCLLGGALSLAAMLLEAFRDSLVFFCLWAIYLSLYQVGQVFLYFQWDNLLLESGFLCILVAPLTIIRGSRGVREHDRVSFWLVRWLLFRLMFASGVVKLTSRCPTWWGLTALTYHYETQCIPTPLAWFAHQLPVWWQKLSVVGTFVIEIVVPFLFFSPLRRLRIGAFYLQVLLQVLIILSGNYNFFNLLTLTLCFSLLDDEHVSFWLCKSGRSREKDKEWKLRSSFCYLLEILVWSLLIYVTIILFDLKVDPVRVAVSSRTAFTHYSFSQFLKLVIFPSVWIGVLSLTWEMLTSIFRCACVTGFLRRFWGMFQCSLFASAAASMFAISLVPFTYIELDCHSSLWPGLRRVHSVVDRYQLVNSYGLFRRMTGVGGRPEVIIEGSRDGVNWMEINFMYKPGNLSVSPPVVTPHQPRLDWQMWFAALGSQSQAPWFTALIYRLLQGKQDVIELIQTDVSQYPFHQQPPTFLRAQRYRYFFTEPNADGSYPDRWWRRVYDEEFYPVVHLGHSFLENMLSQFGLKDKSPPRRVSKGDVVQVVHWFRAQVKGVPAPTLIWSLLACSATCCLLQGLLDRRRRTETALLHKILQSQEKTEEPAEDSDKEWKDSEEKEEEEKEEEKEEEEKDLVKEEEEGEKKADEQPKKEAF